MIPTSGSIISRDPAGRFLIAQDGGRVAVPEETPLAMLAMTVWPTAEGPRIIPVEELLAAHIGLAGHWFAKCQALESLVADLRARLTAHGIDFNADRG